MSLELRSADEVVAPTFDVSMSPTIGKIAAALAKAQAVMGPALKDSTNPHFRNDYASLASCFAACRPIFENGIAITQIPVDGGEGVRVVTWLLHESGEWIKGELWMPVTKSDAQGYGGALTYAKRYGLQSLTGLAPDDDDGNAAVGRPAQPQPIQQPKPGPAKAAPRAAKAAAPVAEPTVVPEPSARNEAFLAALSDVSTFEGLHKLIMEAQTIPEANRGEVFDALSMVGQQLFVEAKDLASVQKGFAVVTQLGQPADLREAANAAYLRFRNGGQ